MKAFSGIAVGGLKDGQRIEHDAAIIEIDGEEFQHAEVYGFGMWRWSRIGSRAAVAQVFDRYSQFRDFASGKTLDVINGMHDKIQELEAAAAGAAAREQTLRDALDTAGRDRYAFAASILQAMKLSNPGPSTAGGLEDEIVQYIEAMHHRDMASGRTIMEIRRLCACAGIEDSKSSTEALVQKLLAKANRLEADLEDAKTKAVELEDSVRAELRSAGHWHDGKPLSHLVDIAIDKERNLHLGSLTEIANALGIAFSIGTGHRGMTETLVNRLKTPVTVTIRNNLGGVGGGGGYQPKSTEPTLEERVAALEEKLNQR